MLATLKQRVISDDPATNGLCWLNGPAGAGKSAIVRSLGEQLEEEDKLAGSFFFFRTDAQRNGTDNFMATITYQLCVAYPTMRPYVEQAIDKEPLIFERSPKKQLRTLILQPAMKAVAHGALAEEESKVLLVDGLDECGKSQQQEELVNVLSELAKKFPAKLTILIASRPERHLRAVFEEEPVQSACSVVTLDRDFEPDVDIRKFLVDKFNEILRKHPLRAQLRKLIVKWPTPEAIDDLVSRASGQFIYASTVIKFISSVRANPVERLEVVLGKRDPGNLEPFEQLDALYAAILRSVPGDDIAEILDMLALLSVISSCWWHGASAVPLRPELVEKLMCLPSGYIGILLVDLESVVKLPDDSDTAVRFYHKSFSEYFFDARRALGFSRSSEKVYGRLMTACIQFELQHCTFPSWELLMGWLLKVHTGDKVDMPFEYQISLNDHPEKILAFFSSLFVVRAISESERTEETANQLRLYFKQYLAAFQTTGPSSRNVDISLSILILLSVSVPKWIVDAPQVCDLVSHPFIKTRLNVTKPLPHYITALWNNYKTCFQATFACASRPADRVLCSALICAPARLIRDLTPTSCFDEAAFVREFNNGTLERLDRMPVFFCWISKSLPLWTMDEGVRAMAKGITCIVYRTMWHESVLALSIMLLKAPTVIDRYVVLLG